MIVINEKKALIEKLKQSINEYEKKLFENERIGMDKESQIRKL